MINLSNGREYFGERFVDEFEKILQECEAYEEFLFVHGTETDEIEMYSDTLGKDI